MRFACVAAQLIGTTPLALSRSSTLRPIAKVAKLNRAPRYSRSLTSSAKMAATKSSHPVPADAEPGFQKMDATIPKASEPSSAATSSTPPPSLPPLTGQDYRIYNRMAEHMDLFHNHFRSTWTTLYIACERNSRPAGMSMRQFLALGEDFCSHLTMHHGIEERHIFPVLAKKMPAFRKELELLTQHKAIHKGLDKFEGYLNECRSGEREVRLKELKEIMDSFGDVLWTHLDEEVKELGAENMRKYWSKDEMARLPM